MDESRDPAAPPERAPAVAARTRLTPIQEAWGAYVNHSLHRCLVCRSADGSPCTTAEGLYRTYRQLTDDAHRQMREL
ncbi:hypothetical protein [Streptomyces hirsutus]|uniref:hypothetical protein n=1 Tax=Streptomyces hirsutus TaxID=35620 RepID=UPI0036AC77A0